MGFVLSVFFNIYAPATLGHNTLLYTAFPNGHGGYEIPFLICMGLSFTFAVMVGMSLAGPVLNPKATAYSPSQFRVAPSTMGHDYRHAAAHHGPLRQVLVTLSSSLVLAPAPTGG